MDFSSLNPVTSNALNLAARNNDVHAVRRLLKKINPNCIDNRGWTCLHEAAAHDSYECLVLILKHPNCRPLAETHEGYTALYLACRNFSSIQTITALLESEDDIANYGSTECVTPLHVICAQGRNDVIQLLIEYGAMLDVQDFDGDTPLHEAVINADASMILLHAGAEPELRNDTSSTPFHMACYKGCYKVVENLYPFVTNINQITINGDTPLILATEGYNPRVVHFLLTNGADPHLMNANGDSALDVALSNGFGDIFKTLLLASDIDKINPDIILLACKPHYFKFEILETLLNYDLGSDFFDFTEPFHVTLEQIGDIRPVYHTNAPLNSYLNICEYIYNHSPERFREFFYLFLMRGVSVNAINIYECPPLVYIHYCAHFKCFKEVFEILREHGCDIDYCTNEGKKSDQNIHVPDAFIASLTSDPSTAPIMLRYSLHCEPGGFVTFAYENGVLGRIPPQVLTGLLSLLDTSQYITVESLPYVATSLQHLCRLKIRFLLRKSGVSSTRQWLEIIKHLQIPQTLQNYLRYL